MRRPASTQLDQSNNHWIATQCCLFSRRLPARPGSHFPTQLLPFVKKLCTSYRPIFTKIQKYCFNTSNGAETITVAILFRRLKILFFYPSRIGNTPNSHKLEAHSKSQYSVYNTGTRGTANAQGFLNWWAKCRCMRVPSQVGCGKVAL